MLVSIIIPTYNRSKFLIKALNVPDALKKEMSLFFLSKNIEIKPFIKFLKISKIAMIRDKRKFLYLKLK